MPKEYTGGSKTANEGRVFEAYVYYEGGKIVTCIDRGTRIRFVEPDGVSPSSSGGFATCIIVLPGLVCMAANFNKTRHLAYFDHWVSNVVSRTGFVDTLTDVLLFALRVDVNSGVVAAGEAQIESTVVRNSSLSMWDIIYENICNWLVSFVW